MEKLFGKFDFINTDFYQVLSKNDYVFKNLHLIDYHSTRSGKNRWILLVPQSGFSYFYDKGRKEVTFLTPAKSGVYYKTFEVLSFNNNCFHVIDGNNIAEIKFDIKDPTYEVIYSPDLWVTHKLFVHNGYLAYWKEDIRLVNVKWAISRRAHKDFEISFVDNRVILYVNGRQFVSEGRYFLYIK